MSRRDTIIVAVLLNVSLLAILFMMAINTDEDKVSEQFESVMPVVVETRKPLTIFESSPMLSNPPSNDVDELDAALNNFANSPQAIVLDEESPEDFEKEFVAPVVVATPVQLPTAKDGDSSSQYVQVVIKRGDSLDKIARANGTTIEALKKANHLKSERLSIGQVLQVPTYAVKKEVAVAKVGNPTSAQTTTLASAAISQAEYYVVKSGDNPWKIAKQFHVKFEDLLKLNNLNEEKARNLKIGDKIRVK